jgi:hypothetical protein
MCATIALYRDRVDYPDGRHESWFERWEELLKQRDYRIRYVDVFASDIIEQLRGCDGFLWRHTHGPSLRWVSRRLLPAVEMQLGIPVYPDQRTTWHYDDKISQRYLLGAAGIPMPRTWIFWRRPDAMAFLRDARYPLVLKLTSGASAQNVRLLKDRAEAEAWAERLFGEGVTNLKDPPRPSLRRAIQSWRPAMDFAFTGRRPHPGGWWEAHKDYMYVQEFLPGNAYDTRIAIFSDHCFGYRRHNRLSVFWLPFRGRTTETSSPGDGALHLKKHAELTAQFMNRNGGLWRQCCDNTHMQPVREVLVLPYRCLIPKRRTDYFQNADEARDPGEVTKQVITYLNLAYGCPTALAEATDHRTRVQELLPSRASKQIKPIVACRHVASRLAARTCRGQRPYDRQAG